MSSYVVYFDTETSGLDPHTSLWLLTSFAIVYDDGRESSHVLSMEGVEKGSKKADKLYDILTNARVVYCWNASFDMKVIWKLYGEIDTIRFQCLMLREQVLYAGLDVGYSLAVVSERRLGITMDKAVRNQFIGRKDFDFTQEELEYSKRDVLHLHTIRTQQDAEIATKRVQAVVDVEQRTLYATAQMEYYGLPFDVERIKAFEQPLRALVERLQREVTEHAFEHDGWVHAAIRLDGSASAFNTRGPQYVQSLQAMGYAVENTSEETLAAYDQEHFGHLEKAPGAVYHNPHLQRLYLLNKCLSIISKYILGLATLVNPVTGNIHGSFNQNGTTTGRYSSSSPNLQNMPTQATLADIPVEGLTIRETITAPEGSVFIIADYSAIELVILGLLAKDDKLLELQAGDLHTYVASRLFNTEVDPKKAKSDPLSLDAAYRKLVKPVTYSIMYGVSGGGLSRKLAPEAAKIGIRITKDVGDSYIQRWKNELFPKTGATLDAYVRKAVTQRYVQTPLGRRRHWPIEVPAHQVQREGANAPIQGASADMTKLALALMYTRLRKGIERSRIMLTVHDEIVAMVPLDRIDEGVQIVKSSMEDSAARIFGEVAREYVVVKPETSLLYNK